MNYIPTVEDLVYMGLTISAVLAFYAVIVGIIVCTAPDEAMRLIRKILGITPRASFA